MPFELRNWGASYPTYVHTYIPVVMATVLVIVTGLTTGVTTRINEHVQFCAPLHVSSNAKDIIIIVSNHRLR